MGTFIGHVVPGSFFVLFGAWWTFQLCRRYLKSFTKRGESFHCSVTYCIKIKGVEVEAIIAISAAVIGMIIELFLANVAKGKPIGASNGQHATMYFFFGLLGFIGLISPAMKKMMPNFEEIRYVSLAMAYAVEALLFLFHLHGRDDLNIALHMLLVYAIYGCVAMTIAEMIFRKQVLTGLGRAYFTILQGTWFWQVAFILYNPMTDHTEWDHENPHQIMLATCIYTWHMGVIFCYALVCGIMWACIYKRKGELGDMELTMEPVSNGYTHLLNHDDAESAIKLEA